MTIDRYRHLPLVTAGESQTRRGATITQEAV